MREIKLLIDDDVDILDIVTTKYLDLDNYTKEEKCIYQFRKYELNEIDVIDIRSKE